MKDLIDGDMVAILDQARCRAGRAEDAIALLVDAAALGLSEGDFDPSVIVLRLCETFNALHLAKHGMTMQ